MVVPTCTLEGARKLATSLASRKGYSKDRMSIVEYATIKVATRSAFDG